MSKEDYEFIELLGEGGFAKVYLARDVQTERLVVIKFIDKNTISRGKNSRVLREAKIPKYLGTNKNIVSAIESFETDDAVYILYEYVPNSTTLDNYTVNLSNENQQLEVLDIFQQLADGLAYMHSKGVAHRDIKAKNILIKGTVPFYIDFDLACGIIPSLRLPCHAGKVGTPNYMAPEVIKKVVEDFAKTDVWSLGVVFYWMLNREMPFYGSNIESKYNSILINEPKPFKTNLPRLDNLVMSMLDKNPTTRPSAVQVRDTLNSMIKEF